MTGQEGFFLDMRMIPALLKLITRWQDLFTWPERLSHQGNSMGERDSVSCSVCVRHVWEEGPVYGEEGYLVE